MRAHFRGWRQTLSSVIPLGALQSSEPDAAPQGTLAQLAYDEADPLLFKHLFAGNASALDKALAADACAPYLETSKDGFTLLHVAVLLGDLALIKRLLADGRFLLDDHINSQGFTPLHIACSSGKFENPCVLVLPLLKSGAAVHVEALKGSLPVEYFVRATLFARLHTLPGEDVLRVLRALTLLLTGMQVAGVCVDRRHQRGSTLLAQCVSYGRTYFAKLLVMNGADIRTTVHGQTLVQIARDNSHSRLASILNDLMQQIPEPPADAEAATAAPRTHAEESGLGAGACQAADPPSAHEQQRTAAGPSAEPCAPPASDVVPPAASCRCFVALHSVQSARCVGAPADDVRVTSIAQGEYFFVDGENTSEYFGATRSTPRCAVPKAALMECEYGRNTLLRHVMLRADRADHVVSTALAVQSRLEEEYTEGTRHSVIMLQAWVRRWEAIKAYKAATLPRARILELIDNERAYVEALHIMNKNLRQVLVENGVADLFPPLRYVPELIPIHTLIHESLEEAWSGRLSLSDPPTKKRRHTSIIDVFNTYLPMLKVYRQLIPELGHYQTLFDATRAENPLFDRIFAEFTQTNIPPRAKEPVGDAKMWFMRMFQHLTKYHLIFKDINKDMRGMLKKFHSKPMMAQAEAVADMVARLEVLTVDVNKKMSDSSANEAVIACQAAIVVKDPHFELTLVAAHRKFVHSQTFARLDAKSHARVLVFSDIFMLLSCSSKQMATDFAGDFITHYHIKYSRVFDLPDIPDKGVINAVQLSVYKPAEGGVDKACKSITLLASSADEKEAFLKTFRSQVKKVLNVLRDSVVVPSRPQIFERLSSSDPTVVKHGSRELAQSGSAFGTMPSSTAYSASMSALPVAAPTSMVVWLDTWARKAQHNESDLFRLQRRYPGVVVRKLNGNSELLRFLEHNRARILEIPRPCFRVVTNSRRDRDGGDQAPENLRRMLRSHEVWEAVPIMIYCGKKARLMHLHDPVARVWVTDSQEEALRYMGMDDLETVCAAAGSDGPALEVPRGGRARSLSSGSLIPLPPSVDATGPTSPRSTLAVSSEDSGQQGFVRGRNRQRRRSAVLMGDMRSRMSGVLGGAQRAASQPQGSADTGGAEGAGGQAPAAAPDGPMLTVSGSDDGDTAVIAVAVAPGGGGAEARADAAAPTRAIAVQHPLMGSDEFSAVAMAGDAPPPPPSDSDDDY